MALREFRPPAEQGHAAAQNNLGNMYANGWGVPEDDRQAVLWYRKAAEQGDARAQFNLGPCTTTVRAFPRTTSKLMRGSISPLHKETRRRNKPGPASGNA